jgi:putative ABC transport system substrate-binding protein
MKRRSFLTLLGGAAAAWPLAAGAQQAAMPVIGILSGASAGAYVTPEFRQGLSLAGYVEGRNVSLEYHWANGQYDRLPALAADLVRRRVNMILATNLQSSVAAKAATSTIPVVFTIGANPIEAGLVVSLSRPGGNVTGATNLNGELGGKRLQLLHETVPAPTVIAALINPTDGFAWKLTADLQAAALTLGRELLILHVSTEHDFDTVFTTLRDRRAGALVISPDAFLNSQVERHAAELLRLGVPAISTRREFAEAGGLMSYVPSLSEMNRTAGIYAGRILKGDKPVDLPVQQVAKIELIINMKTAKVLGVTFPTALLVRADEVIE